MDLAAVDAQRRDLLLDHGRHPHHAGLRNPYDAEVTHLNATCGDQVQLRVLLAGEVVRDVSYDGVGCTVSSASTSMMSDLVIGRTVTEALVVRERFTAMLHDRSGPPGESDADLLGDAVALAGVARHPARVRCALLGWGAFTDAAVRALASSPR